MNTKLVNAMSVDVEDYFHVSAFEGVVSRRAWDEMPRRVRANTGRLLDLFDEAGIRATFFVLGWVAEREPALVREIGSRGHELASHGYAHRLVYDQTLTAFREDVRRAKGVIEDAGGVRVAGYRAPSFSITPRSLWALDVLVEEGHQYDASIFPIVHDRYGIPISARQPYRIERRVGSLVEVPGSTARVGPLNFPVAGGAYFRLLPYWWTKWGIARLNGRDKCPAVFYLHPWEIDPEQPRLSVGRTTTYRHYHNLERTESRLRRLLKDFRFGTVTDVLADTLAPVSDRGVEMPLPYAW